MDTSAKMGGHTEIWHDLVLEDRDIGVGDQFTVILLVIHLAYTS